MLILFVMFATHEERETVPIVHRPTGHGLRFTRLVNALCCRGGGRTSLIHGGFVCFTRDLQEGVRISIRSSDSSGTLSEQVSQGAKASRRGIQGLFHGLHPIVHKRRRINRALVGSLVSKVGRVRGPRP